MTAPTPDIERHPDVVVMRRRYDQIAETPVAQSSDGLAFLAGLYLAMSPWVVGFTDHSALMMSNLFTGLAVTVLAAGFAAAYGRLHGVAWVSPLLGAWAIVSVWAVNGPTPGTSAIVSNVITGGVIVLCAVAMMSGSMRRTRP
ncbi:SPW repeat protein [Jiangella endophytica]|uniref:SPW repeat protein n=1 Tax=Jiangella endophytica TaxID=1623398 RepID=UPI000E349A75|nr:SPW repeat protein [Jiangella endophytica]